MSALFENLPVQVSIQRQIACVEREISYRHRVYQRRIDDGKMSPDKAAEEIACMRAVLASLRAIAVDGGVQ